MNTPVTLSPSAAIEILNIMKNKNIPKEYGLRIGMKGGGGCGSGMSHMLGFDKQKDTDLVYQSEGITIYIEKKHLMYLIGLQVSFRDSEDVRGFSFVNPEQEAEN